MPLYRCQCPNETLTPQARAQIARSITDIHCDVTGAPEIFVHVFFLDTGAGSPHYVTGSSRAGRTDEQKQGLRDRIAAAYAEAAGLASEDVTVTTMDVPAQWIMEGGAVMPEPGEEAAWLEAHGHA